LQTKLRKKNRPPPTKRFSAKDILQIRFLSTSGQFSKCPMQSHKIKAISMLVCKSEQSSREIAQNHQMLSCHKFSVLQNI